MFAKLLCLFAVSLLLVEMLDAKCSDGYYSKDGDTCDEVATLHKLKVTEIKKLNPELKCSHRLKTGTLVCIRGGSVDKDSSKSEEVQTETSTKTALSEIFSMVGEEKQDDEEVGSSFSESEA